MAWISHIGAGARYSGHLPPFSQVRQQEAGSEVEPRGIQSRTGRYKQQLDPPCRSAVLGTLSPTDKSDARPRVRMQTELRPHQSDSFPTPISELRCFSLPMLSFTKPVAPSSVDTVSEMCLMFLFLPNSPVSIRASNAVVLGR